ncbi:cell division protein FtsZ [Marivibrio halodurans]|uniref:Cell division protein FtsZ n=1 Tax=Marivibrio halodurans TaxID=2039722 RepID=A0A8J7S958_9PROT|nr:cell division protein FtsZ [Marivibrio halodurans]MBP5857737.1 cell division protein FtsZ [Marivibrio halodurans]
MTIKIQAPTMEGDLQPRIVVVGVGGAGGNAVNNMIRSNLEGVEFIVANTDAQALKQSEADRKIQLGATVTKGLGAGARPDIGRDAALESMEEMLDHLQGANMVFITAGMGGGTGTGAAPVIAEAAREAGLLTVGVVTRPFHFEGVHRMKAAEQGITELQQFVDTLIIIPNQNLFRVANEKTTFADAFKMADDVLYSGVRGVTDLMVMPGLINLDFADIRTVMGEMGKAMMGTGEAEGENRAIVASESAISNPLLEDVSMKGARGVLINITGGADMTLFEVDEAANRIREEVDADANIIFGSTFDESLDGMMRVSVVATGIEGEAYQGLPRKQATSTPLRGRAQTAPAATPEDTPAEIAAEAESGEEPSAESIEVAEIDPSGGAANETIATPEEAPNGEATTSAAHGEGTHVAETTGERAEAVSGEEQGAAEHPAEAPREAALFPMDDDETPPARAEHADHARPAAPASAPPASTRHKAEGAPEPVRPRDAFIPPQASRPEEMKGARPQSSRADAFAEAAMANGSGREASKPKPKAGLFSRMTGLGLGARGEEQDARPAPRAAAQASEPTLLKRPDGQTPRQAVATERAQPAESARAEPEAKEQAPTRADEEMLEIPAFLRRQAN